MAIGDRILVGDGSTWTNEVTVPVYEPLWESDGRLRVDSYGAATVRSLGGVKGGSTGIIAGNHIRVHRIQMGETHTPGLGGVDLINLFPVAFDYYQKTAWIRAEHIKIVSGTTFKGR